jgi:hypothetical protein
MSSDTAGETGTRRIHRRQALKVGASYVTFAAVGGLSAAAQAAERVSRFGVYEG